MSRQPERDRLYTKRGRFYADFRDYSDVKDGGKQEAMKPKGSHFATRSRDEATAILSARLEELEAKRAGRRAGLRDDPRLTDYATRHLEAKALTRRPNTVKRHEIALRRLAEFCVTDTRLSEIDVSTLADWIRHRRAQPGQRGPRIASSTVRKELSIISDLFKRAVAERVAVENPVSRLEKPSAERGEAEWLEPGEAARLLAAAEAMVADPKARPFPHFPALLATFLLTGGRRAEVFGLLVRDVDLEEGTVHFRPNRYRRLKAARHKRWVPLWPQLRRYLTPLLEQRADASALLFPGRKGMIRSIDGSLREACDRAKIEKHVTCHVFRHTFAATRMQTLDHGHPVSPYTVMRELGHRSIGLIESTYGHLQRRRSRSPVVEYREADVVSIARERGA